MNDQRRKEIEKIKERLSKARAELDSIHTDLENIQGEEQDYLDSMPESLQGGEKGEKAQASVDAMGEALDVIQQSQEELEGVGSNLDTAAE